MTPENASAPPPPRANKYLFRLIFAAPLAIAIALLIAFSAGLFLDPRKVPSALIGKPAPHFKLPLLNDAAKNITPADMKGKVWMLNVWASWCAGCRVEHPLLPLLQNEAPLIGLNYKDKKPDAVEWLNEQGDPYDFSLADARGAAGLEWGVYGVPETFVIDADGIIRHKHIGILDLRAVKEEIIPLLQSLRRH